MATTQKSPVAKWVHASVAAGCRVPSGRVVADDLLSAERVRYLAEKFGDA